MNRPVDRWDLGWFLRVVRFKHAAPIDIVFGSAWITVDLIAVIPLQSLATFWATVPLNEFHNNTPVRFGSLVEQADWHFTPFNVIYFFFIVKKEAQPISSNSLNRLWIAIHKSDRSPAWRWLEFSFDYRTGNEQSLPSRFAVCMVSAAATVWTRRLVASKVSWMLFPIRFYFSFGRQLWCVKRSIRLALTGVRLVWPEIFSQQFVICLRCNARCHQWTRLTTRKD